MESRSEVLINSTLLVKTADALSINAMFVLARISSTIQLVSCGLVLFVFYRLPSLRTEINYPIINLVASDVLRAILSYMSIPFFFKTYEVPSANDKVFCVIFRYMNNVQLAWSGWAIAIIAYSRYDSIANMFSLKLTRKRFWTLTLTSWIVSFLTSLPPIVGWSSYGLRKEKNTYRCTTGSSEKNLASATFLPFFYFVNCVVPSLLVVVLFSCIARIANSRQLENNSSSKDNKMTVLTGFSQLSCGSGQQDRQRAAATQFKKIVFSISFLYIVIIVVTNVLFLAPYVVTTCFDTINHALELHKKIPYVSMQTTIVLFMVNFNVNCLLYIFWIKTFQNATGALCCRRRVSPV